MSSNRSDKNQAQPNYWSVPVSELLQQLQTEPHGLSTAEAERRLLQYGYNLLQPQKKTSSLGLFIAQFKSPIILILIIAAASSFFLGERIDTLIIFAIVALSGLLGFLQEKGAVDAVGKLLSIIEIKATLLRDKKEKEVPIDEVVPGDIVILNAGDAIPGDCAIIESKDLFVDEAALTGETYPVEKMAGVSASEAPLSKRHNALFMGTHVVSGTATAVVVKTGKQTEFGKIANRLKFRPPETEFERGVRRFGYLLLEVTLMLVIFIFAVNVFLNRPVLDSFLFSVALAVGLTPQLLPAIISVNLSHGARRMAKEKVIVKRLASIENFGSMNILCSDKTGTLTEGIVQVEASLDADGNNSDKTFLFAYLNASFETGFTNPIDKAIVNHKALDISKYKKLDEIPYDFIRKRLSILVKQDDKNLLIVKGAFKNVLAVCSNVEGSDGKIYDLAAARQRIVSLYESLSSQGLRALGVAYRNMGSETIIAKDSEKDMIFLGFVTFLDPPKAGIDKTLEQLDQLGVRLKVITGDNRLIAANISRRVGIKSSHILTGQDLNRISNQALLHQANQIDVFAEVEPNQKERIIHALKLAGNVVGYIGDGINDGPALHAADVGISVESAVDVAKEAADIVLLEKDLSVLAHGIQEGRATFANTLKYVFMATSANFGNMFSMAGASLFLPFLPLLPTQVLLTNFMTDLPELTISTDRVDAELVDRPRRWNIHFIRRFMTTFGLLSSVFDYLTFGALLFILHASTSQFRTGWFVESVASASLIVLVIRTKKPFYKSTPSKYLSFMTLIVIGAVILMPYTPLAVLFSFEPLPSLFLVVLGVVLLLYILGAEITKKIFYKRVRF
ncbi:MAG: magnesium-translocating P-type ATPase [Actinomycetota bacterium]